MKTKLDLFRVFFKVGLFTFGGGMAMLPLIEDEVVKKREWITSDDMLNVLAIAEATPGPIAVNTATFIGYKKAGVLGGIFATLGVILPSLIIITIISFFVEKFLSFEYVAYAFMGIRAAVAVLILYSVFKLFKKAKKYWFTYVLAILACVVTLVFPDFSTIYVLIGGAIIGVILQTIQAKIKSDKEKEDNSDAH